MSSDLPTLTGVLTCNAQVDLLEAIGVGPHSESPMSYIHLLGADVHSTPANLAACPVQAKSTGERAYSYERWIRFRFTPPFGGITGLRFWVSDYAPNADWQVLFGLVSTYSTPRKDKSEVATSALPTTDPGVGSPNLMLSSIEGMSVAYAPWIVLQAGRVGYGDGDSLQAAYLNFQFAWVQA